MSTTAEAQTKVRDALDHARSAAQELHGALSDAVAMHSEAIKGNLEALPLKANTIADSIENSLDAQAATTKQAIREAVGYLKATAKYAAQALNSSGHEAERSIQRAIIDARASVQKISEAVAAKRTVESTKSHA